MPNRIIRDSCKTSPSLAALSDLAERTWWRIVATLDDFGRYHGSNLALLAATFPVPPEGLTSKRFQAALEELEAGDLIRFYETCGRRYIYCPTWPKYQRLRSSRSQFPEPIPQALCSLGRGHRAVKSLSSGGQVAVIPPPSAPGVGVGVGVGDDPPKAPQGGPSLFPEGAPTPNGQEGRAPASPRATTSRTRKEPTEDFRRFYQAYPLHKEPDRAERAFRAALKRGATLEDMLAAIGRQVAERKALESAGRFVADWKHPATWLNAGCWKDEATPPAVGLESEAERILPERRCVCHETCAPESKLRAFCHGEHPYRCEAHGGGSR